MRRPRTAELQESLLEVSRTGARPDLGPRPAGDDPARADEQQLVATIGLVHHVAGDEDRDTARSEAPEMGPELHPKQRIDADRGLVEEQDFGPVNEGTRERQPSPLPAGQMGGERVGPISQLDQLEGRPYGRRVTDAIGLGEESDVLGSGQRRVDPIALGHVANPGEGRTRRHVDPKDLRVAARRSGQAGQQPDQGGLAGSVGAEDAVDPARSQLEGHLVDGGERSECLGQAARTDRSRLRCSSGRPRVHRARRHATMSRRRKMTTPASQPPSAATA